MPRSPTMADVLSDALDARLEDVRVCLPARVERYDSTKGAVDAQPLVQQRRQDEAGEDVVESLPVVPGVPVVFPGGGGFVVQFPISVGDTGLLVFSSSSLDRWKDRGGIVDPGSHWRFALGDAVFLPGLRPFSDPRGQAPSGHVLIGRDGGSSEPATLGDTLQDYLQQIRDWLIAHVHTSTSAGNPTSPPTTVATYPGGGVPPTPLLIDVRSSTVKVTR